MVDGTADLKVSEEVRTEESVLDEPKESVSQGDGDEQVVLGVTKEEAASSEGDRPKDEL